MDFRQHSSAPKWMKWTLQLAAIYNLAWGAAVIVAPLLLFRWAGMEEPRYPQIWQCVGMIVGVYGLGYWIAAYNPYRHWPIVLVGFLGKILGPIGFVQSAVAGELPWAWGATIITNDLVWWVPFAMMLYAAFRANTDTSREVDSQKFDSAVNNFRSNRDSTLNEISSTSPTLLVFLRHAGCTFCRETLSEIQRNRNAIEQTGTKIAIVHMGSPMDGTLMLRNYGLDGLHRFSDPNCELYEAFGLKRGSVSQLFGLSVLKRGVEAALCGHGVGLLKGDGFRMPGVFVLAHGEIVEAHRSLTAADAPDYLKMAKHAPRSWRNSGETAADHNANTKRADRESRTSSPQTVLS